MSPAPELSVVIPAYNEAECLESVVRAVLEAARAQGIACELLLVDDGSTDGTGRIARELERALPGVRALAHGSNQGSGQAIRTGIAAARAPLVTYVPADGQFDLAELSRYVAAARAGADVVVGARIARSDYTWFRLLSSRVYLALTNALFRERFRDVNWVHLWRRSLFDELVPRSRGVYFLDEVLVRARRAGRSIVEIRSRYLPRRAGSAKGSRPRTILLTLVELLRCWWELRMSPRAAYGKSDSRHLGSGSGRTCRVAPRNG